MIKTLVSTLPIHRASGSLSRTPLKVVLVHGGVEALVPVHARLVQVLGELAGKSMESLRCSLMTGSHTPVLVRRGPVHGVLLLIGVALDHILQVTLHCGVGGVEVDILHLGTCVH